MTSVPVYVIITPHSFRSPDQDDPVESFCGSQPRSKEAFWSRVETFSVSFYSKFQLLTVPAVGKFGKKGFIEIPEASPEIQASSRLLLVFENRT